MSLAKELGLKEDKKAVEEVVEKAAKLSPFDYLNSINTTKKDIMVDDVAEKQYSPYMVNRGLSYFVDTVHMANEMNRYHFLDNRLQYSFLINIVRPAKRFSKWFKADKNELIELVKEYYGYSTRKAREVLPLLTQSQLKMIEEKLEKGGKK